MSGEPDSAEMVTIHPTRGQSIGGGAKVVPQSDAQDAQAMLNELDNAKISWFHVKTVIIAGMGFFCDAYDLFSISLVTKTIARVYYPDVRYYSPENCASAFGPATPYPDLCGTKYKSYLHVPGAMPINTGYAITSVALIGTLVGQLLFGWLGDKFGRKPVFGLTLVMMVIFSIGSGLSWGTTPTATVGTLCFMRFCLGLGIGGDYPLSATLMSEYSSKSNRGAFVAAVFAMQGTGILTAAIVTLVLSSIWNAVDGNPDYLWRFVLSFGAIPTAATMYARLSMPETPRYTLFVKGKAREMRSDMNMVLTQGGETSTRKSVTTPVQQREDSVGTASWTYMEFFKTYGLRLFGCSICWFLLDIAFYSQNFFQSDIFTTIGWIPTANTMNAASEAYHIARAQAIIALCSTIPGYWFTVFTIEHMGRWKIQLMGFFFMTLFMGILAGEYTYLVAHSIGGFVTLYAFTFFFSNWGPNATTFVVPSELFPSKYRSTAHGIAAACGKAGAIVGTFGFGIAKTNIGVQKALGIMTAVNFLGFCFTFLVPETKGKSLEELSDDKVSEATPSAAPLKSADGTEGEGDGRWP